MHRKSGKKLNTNYFCDNYKYYDHFKKRNLKTNRKILPRK